MTRLAFLLFAIVLSTHYGYEPAVDLFGIGTPARWFYVLRGFAGTALFLLIMVLLPLRWPVRARDAVRRISDGGALACCAWGAVEEGQTALCRLALGLDRPPSDRPQCDAITGLPIYVTTLIVVLWVLIKTFKDR